MASVDVDLIPGVWLQVSRVGAVLACNRAARDAMPGIAVAPSWHDWLGEDDVSRLPLEWAGVAEGTVWQGKVALRAARPAGFWRGRVVADGGGFAVLLEVPGGEAEVAPLGEFLGRFCHDVRVPVAAVKSSLFLLDRHGQAVQGEREQKWLAAATQSLAGLETLVRAVGELGEWAEAMRVRRSMELVEVGRILEERVEAVGGRAPGATIEVAWPPEVPRTWRMDAQAWTAALDPLLHNAVRHAVSGDTVVVRVARVAESLEVAVSDGGPGVAPEEEGRLFRPFFHSRHDVARGTGLGLATARAAARALGGELSYARCAGRTVFTLRVKAEPAGP